MKHSGKVEGNEGVPLVGYAYVWPEALLIPYNGSRDGDQGLSSASNACGVTIRIPW